MTRTQTPSPSSESQSATPRRSHVPLLLTILMILIAAAAGAGISYFMTVVKPTQAAKEYTSKTVLKMTGLANPVHNKLNARFSDADGDLVADAPSDANQLIDPPKLVFSYVAVDDPTQYAKDWQPFCDHLSKVTGKPVEYLQVKTTEDQLKAIRDGQLQVTGLNTGSVPIAVDACGFVPVCRIGTGDPKGTHIEIIVPADSSIQSIEDLKGHELTLTEPNSNSGYKAPLVLLRSKGLEPEKDYTLRASGGHEESVHGIAKKQYEAAAVASDILGRMLARGDVKKSDYRSIYQSESFPSAALGYVYNLKPELASKVKDAMLSFDFKGSALENELGWSGETKFLPVSYKDDWALIRRIDDESGRLHELGSTSTASTGPATRPAG
jgi:phosphonate transport system substrate-binding protein